MPTTPPNERLTLQLVFETISEGVVILDADGNVICVNPAAAEIVGFKKHQFETMNTYDVPPTLQLFKPDMSPMAGTEMAGARALFEKQPVTGLLIGVKQTSRDLRWILSDARPLFVEGQLIGAVVVFRDVTERQRIIDKLRHSERRYSAVIDAITDALRNMHAITDDSSRIDQLSRRERDILTLVAQGWDNRRIAARLEIQESSVRSHVSTINHKLGCANRVEATLIALRARLVNLYE